MLVAALKFRFKQCEKQQFSFKRLARFSKSKRPHKAISAIEMEAMFERSRPKLEMNVAIHLLYDLGGRLQDLLKMQYGQLQGELIEWEMQKVKRNRQGVITEETRHLIEELQRKNSSKDEDFIYTCSIGALKKRVNRFLKDYLKVPYTSHDFRHSKVTHLLNEGVQLKEVSTYVGHSNPSTTLKYHNVDQA